MLQMMRDAVPAEYKTEALFVARRCDYKQYKASEPRARFGQPVETLLV